MTQSQITESVPTRVRHIDHLNLTVRDLEASLSFYHDLFGFQIVEEDPSDPIPWAIIRSGEAMLCLYEHPELPEGPHYPARPNEQGMRHFALRIENGSEFFELTKKYSLSLMYGGPVEWPHSTSYYLSDPSGHHVEVVAWNNDSIFF